ncbi:protein Smaug homolog 1 [Diaphorina citri]|uniref:Protein Smaug homolog 1 n=1 Tax=Diaphorina citri TaxID=121845 RepID=A0A1S3D7E8_DIACI|nr:protein Smaug homolog 1 [Diaphorina citri]
MCFISGLLDEKKDLAFAQLLAHVPLLHPNNTDAKTQYLSLFERLLPYATETSSCVESVQQLFTYIVIHPAFKNEKEQILLWKRFLENTICKIGLSRSNSQKTKNVPPSSYETENTPVGLNEAGSFDNIFINEATTPTSQCSEPTRTKRSSSLTPPILFPSVSEEALVHGSRRLSLSDQVQSSCCTLSPHSSLNSSSSESQLDDLKTEFLQKDVKAWLKYLRLHKYGPLFVNLTYEQILSIDENTFDSIIDTQVAVTQGAKRKIISSIRKLHDRYSVLCQLEQDVLIGNLKTMKHILNEIKILLITPMRLVNEDDISVPPRLNIPAQIIKVLGKVYSQLFIIQVLPEEYGELCSVVELFISCMEVILNLTSFNRQQKIVVNTWRIKVNSCLSKSHKMHGYVFRPKSSLGPFKQSPGSPVTKSPTTPTPANATPTQGKGPPPTSEFDHLVRSVVELGME